MLIDSIDVKENVRTKVCVIGSGVGGGTVARKLADLGVDFVVVEAGGLKGESDIIQKTHVGRDFGIRKTTSIQLGGTSNFWHGVLSPLDKIDFSRREWIPHSGWPIDLEDLVPYYQEAAKLLGVENFDYFFNESLSSELKGKVKELEFNRGYLKNKIFQQPLPCVNFKHVVKDIVDGSSNQHCYYNAAALELLTNEAGNNVEKLLVGTKADSRFLIEADQFVVAAGTLETPRLLLNSRKTVSCGLGNGGGNVGRYLSDHPMGNLSQIEFKRPQKAHLYSDFKISPNVKVKSGLELTEERQKELGLPNHNFFLRPSFIKGIDDESEKVKLSLLSFKDGGVTFGDAVRVVTNLNTVRQILAYKLSLNVTFKYADLFFVTEQIPNPDSRVSLSPEKDRFGYPMAEVCWRLLPEDIEGMRVMFDLALNTFFPSKFYRFTYSSSDFDWEKRLTSAIHHVGTARMAESEVSGVTDKNQKVFGVENLFVADGSLFSTAGNVNVSFTTSALACRLVHYLSARGFL